MQGTIVWVPAGLPVPRDVLSLLEGARTSAFAAFVREDGGSGEVEGRGGDAAAKRSRGISAGNKSKVENILQGALCVFVCVVPCYVMWFLLALLVLVTSANEKGRVSCAQAVLASCSAVWWLPLVLVPSPKHLPGPGTIQCLLLV